MGVDKLRGAMKGGEKRIVFYALWPYFALVTEATEREHNE